LATHTIEITLRNEGSSAISKYQLAIETALANHLAHISAFDDHDRNLDVSKGESKTGYVFFFFSLFKYLDQKKKMTQKKKNQIQFNFKFQ